ncbi:MULTISPECIES: GTPase [Acidobacterium]|uniref:G domain-containing protein n=1 Tax=Acidobacterium capsulatum (strain ATCC 51196 / DSM 11244 / BCRC 80197 / JCM 7670 / NBRC 15755 / NCIMB 13165 / 161) TaxID=240015 RepID=C1F5L2_ACIC5|nr:MULTISPECIES: GTPase [Acidobacterium]ACO33007.1 hypothetical protein ACP_3192 [Acidobacterium capsulatum ATCC 51196]HCT61216.1 hypothetical protein [Acidobacterium sp.]
MNDRLFVAVIGERNAGKSTTWNTLFGRTVNTGKKPRMLDISSAGAVEIRLISGSNEERDRNLADVLAPRSLEVFVISGSNEEKKRYAQKVLENVECRIVLCSVQYVEEAFERTWDYIFSEGFSIYAQWLNPGHNGRETWDQLGLVDRLLANGAVVSIRDGRKSDAILHSRVEEIRQYVHGWASPRGLIR